MGVRFVLPVAVVTVVVALTAVGCGSDSGNGSDDAASSPSTSAPSSASAGPSASESPSPAEETAVPNALRFNATTVDGKSFDARALAGKPTVLWFWAPWCPKCRAQAAETAKVAADTAGRVNFLGVAGLDQNAAMRDFVSDTGTGSFPHLSDEDGAVWRRFEVTEQSRYVILDKDGSTVYEGVFPGGDGLAEKVAGLAG
ncbi:redoxin family protein [Streptomyces sp. NPDC051940]|uniref:redoxin family protein n=1 Tax=Streptomyces sp. NPDC051940 TaxID=3155675 RepID=UPI00343C8939